MEKGKEVVEEMYDDNKEDVAKRQKHMKEALLNMLAKEECHVYSFRSSAHEYQDHWEYNVQIHKMFPTDKDKTGKEYK